MNIERVQKSLAVVLILSEASHVFCCVLPTLFSVMSVAAGFGMIAAMPAGLAALHESLHRWEVPMILASGSIVLAGWGAYFIARRLDCHSTGCVHEPCGPRKKSAGTVLKIASALFVFNVSIYLLFHHGLEALATGMSHH